MRDGRAAGRIRAQRGASYRIPEPRSPRHQQLQVAFFWQHSRMRFCHSSNAYHRAYQIVKFSTCHVQARRTRQHRPRVRPHRKQFRVV